MTATTRGYETLVIFKAMGSEQELARSSAQLEEVIKKLGGRIDRSESLGRRRLAFRISRQAEGHYHLVRFTAPTGQIAELERLFRLNESVVRFIILSEEEMPPPSAPRVGSGQETALQGASPTRS